MCANKAARNLWYHAIITHSINRVRKPNQGVGLQRVVASTFYCQGFTHLGMNLNHLKKKKKRPNQRPTMFGLITCHRQTHASSYSNHGSPIALDETEQNAPRVSLVLFVFFRKELNELSGKP